MGIIDNIVNKAENEAEYSVNNKINSEITSGFNKIGSAKNVLKCPNCKAPLPDPSPRFCPKCGAKLIVTCTKCKKDYPIGTQFCPDDGTKLS